MTPIESALSEIDTRLKAATPGKWQERVWIGPLEWPEGTKASVIGHGPIHEYSTGCNDLAMADMVLIAAAPTDLARLVAAVRVAVGALEDVCPALEKLADTLRNPDATNIPELTRIHEHDACLIASGWIHSFVVKKALESMVRVLKGEG